MDKIVILNNQSVVHQLVQNHEKACQLVNMILTFLQNHFESAEALNIGEKIRHFMTKRTASAEISSFISSNHVNIVALLSKKWEAGKYYLQLSGLYSQNQQHKLSL